MKINACLTGREVINILIISILLISSFISQSPAAAYAAEAAAPVSVPDGEMLQFRAGGHVLGFMPGGIMAASRDHMVRTGFIGSNDVVPETDGWAAVEGSPGKAAPLSRVTYRNAWDGVTLVYEASPGRILESTYYLDSPERAERIRLGYNRPLSLDEAGDLIIACESGRMVESAPLAWQEVEGQRRPVEAHWVLHGEKEAGFCLSGCVPGLPVVIDPYLTWNTFLGVGTEYGYGIALDAGGNVYVAGSSTLTWGLPVRPHYTGYNNDAFVAKLFADNGTLVWNTFLGDNGTDVGWGIAADSSGNVFVVGESTATWGGGSMNGGNPVHDFIDASGHYDTFVARLRADNGTLAWNTFMGDNATDDRGFAIAVDGSGSVYAAGYSFRSWGGGTQNGGNPVRPFTGTSSDGFAARLVCENGTLVWNTFLGGGLSDYAFGIACGSGNAYVAGRSEGSWGSPVRAFSGTSSDAYAARLVGDNGTLVWHSFVGGNNYDDGRAIAVDGSGNVYLSGSSSYWWGSPVVPYTDGSDALVAKIADNGSLAWHSFLGGYGQEQGSAITVDGSGNVYTAGSSTGPWGNPVFNYHQPSGTNTYDAFAARLTGSGNLTWNAFLGCTADDKGYGIALDGSRNICVTGYSDGIWGSPVDNFTAPGHNAFIAKINPATSLPSVYTYNAENIGRTFANLKGQVVVDGGEACQYRFCRGTSPGIYPDCTAWTGSKTYSQFFSENVTTLAGGVKYYYIAQAKNSAGEASGNEISFTTTPPTNTGIYGRVGVGIDPPQKILHVTGSGPGTVPLFSRGTDSAGFIIERTSTNRWVFGVNESPSRQFVISTFPEGSGSSVARLSIDVSGNVTIPGSLSKGGGSFKIDHPLSPADKYLLHSFVESPDMLNIYSGSVLLDGRGEAFVELPAYFGALNRDYTYQVEQVGGFAPLYVSQEAEGNKFRIAGGQPGIKVSWQVTGIRHDPYAEAHTVIVEQDKPVGERGFYLHPLEWGKPGQGLLR